MFFSEHSEYSGLYRRVDYRVTELLAVLAMHVIDWLSMVLRLHQHNIGYTADGFYRSDDPTNSIKAPKEGG